MGEWMGLRAADGHEVGAYITRPVGRPIGALVVIQEIFGVNQSIKNVVDSYAGDGFMVVAPAMFDRLEKGVVLGYGPEDMKKAMSLYPQLKPETALLDIAAAYEYVHQSGKAVGILGFCYGGLMSWLSATRGEDVKMQPACCVGYYAGGIGKFAAEEPSCPVQLHFGAADDHIGKDQIDAVRTAHPEVEIHLYEGAGHAFANPDRPSYVEAAAKLARERTLEFLKANIA
jgi:carboxymethylenebutenolidase